MKKIKLDSSYILKPRLIIKREDMTADKIYFLNHLGLYFFQHFIEIEK